MKRNRGGGGGFCDFCVGKNRRVSNYKGGFDDRMAGGKDSRGAHPITCVRRFGPWKPAKSMLQATTPAFSQGDYSLRGLPFDISHTKSPVFSRQNLGFVFHAESIC